MTGAEARGGLVVEADDAYMALLERLENAGWATTGSFGSDEVAADFYRRDDKLDVGFVEATERLGLVGEDGLMLPGFSLAVDEDTGKVVIGYEGPNDERFDGFIDDVTAWGEELEARQADALERQPMADWARKESDRLARQVSEHGSASLIVTEAYERGMSPQDIVSEVTRQSLASMVHRVGADAVPDYLESLFAVVAERQDGLLDRIVTDPDTAVRYESLALDGIAMGVQQEIVRGRDKAVRTALVEAV